ncbi:hypothetical protein QQS21_012939 [Conoideocrella luteorostrata]|uniref:Acetyl esterase n=1 Tax=Conoideocrella luteorostrata TaxID=1105319 RepID=A0AAJ0CA77_9HYPO|nr:hypothetical protein QQS21_012939 [Conoideocrella luteorostrata]
MRLQTLLAAALPASAAPASPNTYGRLENLVSFGDSYTDEGRFDYFVQHRQAPPLGQMLPPSNSTYSGGYAWGRFVANATGAKYYNYAVGGAQCSNNIDSRNLDVVNGPFPSVLEYEIPTFEQDLHYADLYPDRRADNTIYTLWIGTNDLGIDGILGDKNKAGTTISTYMSCIWSVFDSIYRTGGRHFVLFNQAPLEHAPMYATPGQSGRGNNQYWKNPTAYNITQYSSKLREYTTSVNTLYDYGAPFFLKVKRRYPGATFSIFDIHSLTMDVINKPGEYLDAPANVTAPYRICLDSCVSSDQPMSSFIWYDELHPSERMDMIYSKEFIEVVKGTSKYGTYYT